MRVRLIIELRGLVRRRLVADLPDQNMARLLGQALLEGMELGFFEGVLKQCLQIPPILTLKAVDHLDALRGLPPW